MHIYIYIHIYYKQLVSRDFPITRGFRVPAKGEPTKGYP